MMSSPFRNEMYISTLVHTSSHALHTWAWKSNRQLRWLQPFALRLRLVLMSGARRGFPSARASTAAAQLLLAAFPYLHKLSDEDFEAVARIVKSMADK
jgi:hypothetical protein